jgi:hypothetical protein
MSHRKVAGTALWLLCLPLAVLSASCQRQLQQQQSRQVQSESPDGNLQEVRDLVAATKNSQAAQIESNQVGAPIHVDPYPHGGTKGHNIAGMSHAEHPAAATARH